MAGHALIAVLPLRLDLDHHPGKFRLEGLHPGHLIKGKVGAEAGLMEAGFFGVLQLGRQLLGVQAQQLPQAARQLRDIPHILQDHHQFVAGPVGHQHLAVVVQNHAPPGGQILEADAIVLRTLLHLIPLHQLQEPETQKQDPKEAQDDKGGAGEGAADAVLFFRVHHPAGGAFPELKA